MTQQLLKTLQEDREKRLTSIAKQLGRAREYVLQTKGLILQNLLSDWEVVDHYKSFNNS